MVDLAAVGFHGAQDLENQNGDGVADDDDEPGYEDHDAGWRKDDCHHRSHSEETDAPDEVNNGCGDLQVQRLK